MYDLAMLQIGQTVVTAGQKLVHHQARIDLLQLHVYAAAWTWHRVKTGHPHAARLVLAFLTVYLLWEFATRPW